MAAKKKPKLPASVESKKDGRVIVETINVHGHQKRVNGAKYYAMSKALLKVLPRKSPGLTQAEMMRAR